MISQMLAEQVSAAESGKSPAEIAELTEGRLEKLFRRRVKRRLIIGAAMLMLIAFLIDVVRRPEAFGHTMPWVVPIAVLIGVALGKYLKQAKMPLKRQSPQATVLPSAEPTAKLHIGNAEPIPSVTERTTRTLEPSLDKKPTAYE